MKKFMCFLLAVSCCTGCATSSGRKVGLIDVAVVAALAPVAIAGTILFGEPGPQQAPMTTSLQTEVQVVYETQTPLCRPWNGQIICPGNYIAPQPVFIGRAGHMIQKQHHRQPKHRNRKGRH